MSLKEKLKDTIDKLKADKHEQLYLRLEPRAKNRNSEANLAMPIADPLWMLGRQWQFGEFIGEDSGSPVSVTIHHKKVKVDQVYFGKQNQMGDTDDVPLETVVEAMPIDLEKDWKLRVTIGKKIAKRLSKSQLVRLENYKIKKPDNFNELDQKTKKFIQWMEGKCLDGHELFDLNEKDIDTSIFQIIKQEEQRFYKLYSQPEDKNAKEKAQNQCSLLFSFCLFAVLIVLNS